MKIETFTESLPVRLTSAEQLDRGRELAERVAAIEAHRDKAKTIKRQLADTEKDLTEDVLRLSRVVSRCEESRAVECREEADLAGRVVHVMRLDTGEIVRSRGMSPGEYEAASQGELFGHVREAARRAAAERPDGEMAVAGDAEAET